MMLIVVQILLLVMLTADIILNRYCIKLLKKFERRHRSRHVFVFLTLGGFRINMDNVKVSKQYNLVLAEKDEFGNVVAGAPDAGAVISVTDPTLATIGLAADGVTPALIPTGRLGSCQLQMQGTLSGKAFLAVDDLTFIAGDAVTVQISLVEGADNVVTP